MWYMIVLFAIAFQSLPIVSINETCWPTANNLTCVLNDLLLGYNKYQRPNYTGRNYASKVAERKIDYFRRSNSCRSLLNDH